MIQMPIVYVSDMDASISFYEALGLKVDARDPDGLPIQINEHDAELHT